MARKSLQTKFSMKPIAYHESVRFEGHNDVIQRPRKGQIGRAAIRLDVMVDGLGIAAWRAFNIKHTYAM
jgi:hypothetical protein